VSSAVSRLRSLVARVRSRLSSALSRVRASAAARQANVVGGSRPALWPLWIVAAAGAAIAADELISRRHSSQRSTEPPPAPASTVPGDLGKAPCPSNTLPDHGVCIPVPPREAPESDGVSVALDLLPGRPSDYTRYVTPIVEHTAATSPDGGSIVRAPAGTEVRAIRLESQRGPTRWASLQSAEPVLLTLHRVQRGSSLRSYVLVYRGVEFQAPGTWTDIPDGGVIARVGGALEPAGLRFRVRQLRRGAQGEPALSERLIGDSSSLDCDPRNVLPLTPG